MSSINLAVILVCGCGVGILLMGAHPAGLDPISGYLLMALACAAFASALFSRHNKRTFWASLWIAFALLGTGRALITHPPATPADLAYYNHPSTQPDNPSTRYLITGVISGEPLQKGRSQQLRISAETIRLTPSDQPIPIKGDLLALVPPYPAYSFGERLSLEGQLTNPPNFGDFDYAAWLARQGVYSYLSFPNISSLGHTTASSYEELITNARSSARNALRREISEPQAALTVGVVVGDRSQLSDEIINAFRRTGTTHILAISGQNITALVGIILLIWGGNNRRRIMPIWLLITSIVLITFYTGFTGASPSVVRAAIMGVIVLIAPLVHRRYDPMAALALSAAGMVFLDPDVILDAGFQLSFLAMWGLVVFSPSISDGLQRLGIGKVRFPRLLAYPLAVGLSAQIATLPLTMVISGQVSLVSLFATITADIALVPLMLTGIITAALGSIPFVLFSWLAWPIGIATWLSAAWMLWWVEWWSSLSWAAIPIENFNSNYTLIYYAALFAAVWLFSESHRNDKHVKLWPHLRLSLLGSIAVAIWTTAILIVFNK